MGPSFVSWELYINENGARGWQALLYSRRKTVCSALILEDKKDNTLCWLDGLETNSEFKGQGYAKHLLKIAQFELANQKFDRMRLVVQPYSHKTLDQTQLMRFYSKHGFEDTAESVRQLLPIMECKL